MSNVNGGYPGPDEGMNYVMYFSTYKGNLIQVR